MKLKTIVLLPALAIAILIASIGTAFTQTETITFDDLSAADGAGGEITNGYGGLQWNNFVFLDVGRK
jgi:hypothetical protein